METVFSWLGAALGALLLVAVLVAWWEHLVRSARPPKPPAPSGPRAVSVDVQLEALPAAAAASAEGAAPAANRAPGDAAERRTTLDSAMSRMARAGQDSNAWTETSPMVLHAPTEAPLQAGAAAPVSAADADSAASPAPPTLTRA